MSSPPRNKNHRFKEPLPQKYQKIETAGRALGDMTGMTLNTPTFIPTTDSMDQRKRDKKKLEKENLALVSHSSAPV